MIPENDTEWYQFACPRCEQRWALSYEVRRVTDDAGQIRSFYTSQGLPCEAPAHAQATCTSCSYAPVHTELLGGPPAEIPPGPLAPGTGEQPAVPAAPHHYGALDASRRYTFEAIISLDSAGIPGGWQPRQAVSQYSAETHTLMVHVPYQGEAGKGEAGKGEFLPAIVTRSDEQPLRPGDSHVTVTISVPRDEGSEVFTPGRHFALWAGIDVGHGTVLRRVLFD